MYVHVEVIINTRVSVMLNVEKVQRKKIVNISKITFKYVY
jgi:hypothetical protein